MSKGLASRAFTGLKWTTASTVANAVMQIGYTSVMARLLAPEAFGLVSLATVILGFGNYFANLGLNQAIIQKEELSKENIRAAFTTSVLLGVVITVVVWFLAPTAALFFENEEVAPIVRIMAFSFLINGFSSTALSLLQREMRFKAMGIVETASYIISYLIVGVVLAYLGFGFWSLVYATLTQVVLTAIGSYFMVRHSVFPILYWPAYKPLFNYGSKMSFLGVLEYIYSQLHIILVGKVLGMHKLGIYTRAHMLVNLPMYNITRTISKVIFPSFSKLQNDVLKLGKVYLSSITLLAAVLIPVCMGILVAAPELVRIVLGEQWGEAVPVLQVLSLAIPISFITMFSGIVCDAKAELNLKIVITIVYMVVLIGLFLLLKGYGLVGFAAAVFFGEVIRMGLFQFAMKRILSVSFRNQLRCYIPGVLNGTLIAVAVHLLSLFLREMQLPVVVIFAMQLAACGILFLLFTLLYPHKVLKSEISLVLNKMGLQEDTSSFTGRIISKYKNSIIQEPEGV
ncbi:lipopolysaccharide biosynthesis protein [Pontibacter cellulosilyticus]|uniref:Lipopolysaccharide biosynthesis protein n=1 Tax=Pontibacter cellulosilyticus TaxID=1720253 RepID=A0A923N3J1_9BACT|nr:lipopolysaccharide biosynthesis protein [Pontibacter cellulosilyticus]MBC5991214.1 lipopolysaccharide biosynthesis protein [Pontibacter cellulosilyticus]